MTSERLQAALLSSPAVVFTQDLQLRYTWIHNPKKPFEPEQVLGKDDFDLLPRADAEALARVKRGVLESGVGAREVVRTTIAGETRFYDLAVEPLRDDAGQVVGISCASWDITDQRRAEEEQRLLAEAGAVLMAAGLDEEVTLKNLGELIVREFADWCVIDIVEAGRVRRLRVACSAPERRSLAAALERADIDRSRPHLMFEPLEHRRAAMVSRVSPGVLEAMAQSPEHLRLIRALEVRSFMAVPLIARGRLIGALALISSRDERRFAPRDLRVAEELARLAALAVDNTQLHRSTQRAIAARDEVIGILAHDLRNPLNTVVVHSEMLRLRGAPHTGRWESSIEAIRKAALRMNRLIGDMLDIARLDGGALTVRCAAVPIRRVIAEAVELHRPQAAASDMQIRIEAAEELPDVWVDRERLLQVFDNLIGNAIKFTGQGGRVTVGAAQRGGELVLSVSDTGMGITGEHLANLFDRFWQAKKADRRGAGLGLSIAKGIIEAHRGRIWVKSAPGSGTTFFFTVPIASTAEARAASSG